MTALPKRFSQVSYQRAGGAIRQYEPRHYAPLVADENPRGQSDIGVAPSTITRILKGERSPGLDLMAKIKAGTRGRVKAEDWLRQVEESAA